MTLLVLSGLLSDRWAAIFMLSIQFMYVTVYTSHGLHCVHAHSCVSYLLYVSRLLCVSKVLVYATWFNVCRNIFLTSSSHLMCSVFMLVHCSLCSVFRALIWWHEHCGALHGYWWLLLLVQRWQHMEDQRLVEELEFQAFLLKQLNDHKTRWTCVRMSVKDSSCLDSFYSFVKSHFSRSGPQQTNGKYRT